MDDTTSQAEAQAPTTAVDRSAAFENTDDAAPAIVLAAVRACAASWVPEARILGNVRAGDIVRALTTTAASVLTEDERRLLDDVAGFLASENSLVNSHEHARKIRDLRDRLTVGAPAPASTMPARDEIAREVRDWAATHFGPFEDNELDFTDHELADTILALIAKGDTP